MEKCKFCGGYIALMNTREGTSEWGHINADEPQRFIFYCVTPAGEFERVKPEPKKHYLKQYFNGKV